MLALTRKSQVSRRHHVEVTESDFVARLTHHIGVRNRQSGRGCKAAAKLGTTGAER